jgi:adenylate cyclase
MAVEIERKFLIGNDGWRGLAVRVRQIRQGYLASGEKAGVRVRCAEGGEGTLTVKTARAGATRGEFEFSIPYADAEALLGLCEGAIVEKSRHEVPFAGFMWEIDVFQGANAGLVVAEVELEREDQAFERPGWLGEEVTHDRRYYNAALARRPFGAWRGQSGEPGGADSE